MHICVYIHTHRDTYMPHRCTFAFRGIQIYMSRILAVAKSFIPKIDKNFRKFIFIHVLIQLFFSIYVCV